MQAFEVTDLITRQNQSGQDYLEFLKVPSLSVGLYTLPAGGVDKQTPGTPRTKSTTSWAAAPPSWLEMRIARYRQDQ